MDVILTRRSIRKFESLDIPEKLTEDLLHAAMAAPSAGNQQAWQFVVINKRDLLDKIPEIHPYAKMMKEAPLAIMVCGDLEAEKHKDYWVQDCSAATQNILLAARDLGLGSVWLGVHPREDRVKALSELFGLPEHVVPLSLIAIGIPDEQKPPANRYDETKIHYNKW